MKPYLEDKNLSLDAKGMMSLVCNLSTRHDIKNSYLTDKSISLRAKGLLSILLELPAQSKVSASSLKKYCSDSIRDIVNGLNELESEKYVELSNANIKVMGV